VEIGTGDIIVAMQLRHALTVLPRATARACRVIMLSSLLLPKFAPIRDPYGKPRDQFRTVFDLIDSGVLRMAQLRRLAGSGTK
jgi:protein-tyrosine-phosphatase